MAPERTPSSEEGEAKTVRRPVTSAPPAGGGYARKSSPSAAPAPNPLRPAEPDLSWSAVDRASRPATAVIPRAPAVPRDLPDDEGEGGELERLKRALGRGEDRQKSLASDIDLLKQELATAAERYATLARAHETLQAQHDSLRSLVAVRADRIRELEQAVAAREAAREADGARLAEEHARAVAALEERHRAQIEEQRAEHERQRAAEISSRPAEKAPDDLRRIKGIGPKFAKALEAAGVVSFAQIAAWTESDVAMMAKTLKVHAARISKDGWIASAAALIGAEAPSTAPDPEPPVEPPVAEPPPPEPAAIAEAAAPLEPLAMAEEPSAAPPPPEPPAIEVVEVVETHAPPGATAPIPDEEVETPVPGSIRPVDDDVETSW